MNLGLTPVDIATLTEKTEGWIAGLQLASISLQGHHDKQAFVRNFAGDDRHVADYLLDEILVRQAPHIQTFLLKTSILNRLSAPLCDAVTNRNDSQAILAELERANLFLVPLDNQRSWYRYHHLFAELLQVRLLEIMPDEVHNLYRLTSAWYERKGLFSQAASYALKGGDLKGVSRLVERNVFTLVDAKELSVLAKQLDMLPDEEYKTDPWMALTKAWIQAFTGNFQSVEPLLQRIEGMIEEIDSPDSRRVLGRIISLRAYMMSGLGKKKDCIQLAQKAMDQLPEDDVIMRCFTLSSMGNAHRDIGNLQTAIELLNEAALTARAANDSNMSVMILCRLVAAQRMIGRLNQAQNSCYEALEIAQDYKKRTGRNLPIVAYAYFRMGELLYAQNDLENAMRLVEDGLSLSEKWGHFDILLLGLRTKTIILQALGIREGLLDAVQQSYRIRQGITLKSKKKYPTGEADYRLVLGDLDWLGNWVLSNRMDVQDEIKFQDYYSYFIFLRFLKAQGPLRKYEFLLTRLLDISDQAGAVARKIELMTMQAVLYFEKGDLEDALVILEQAFSMAEPEGFVRVFLNQGESMAQLLYQAAIQGIRPEFCNRLLAQFSTPNRAGVSPQDDLVEPLSDREKEVLKFIAQGATNQEIAQELILSLHTVKSHARHIYGKLGVKNRTEAVARARLIGLLPQD
jgi:LuxR family maltose regulon positive regulatory protein